MSEKKFEIIDEHYVGYYQGTAFLISNGENEWYIWEEKEKAQELVDLLNNLIEENEKLRIQNELLTEQNREYKTLLEKKYGKYLKEKFKRNDE